MRILVVDDTKSILLVLKTLLTKWGHDVLCADDGREAWELLQRERVSMVVSDWMMPEMDGPTLCKRIRDAAFDHYIYFILLTSRDDKSDVIEGMSFGADDFVTKPFSTAELEVRVNAGIRVITLQERLELQNQQLTETLDTVSRDLEAASRTQVSLLPKSGQNLSDLQFDWVFEPSTYVGGDVFGYFPLSQDLVAFYSIDVSGHGVPAALISVTLNKFITPELCRGGQGQTGKLRSPEDVVAILNDEFQNSGADTFYFTMLYGVHNARTGATCMCQAAHPHPLLLREDGKIEQLGDGGLPVAMLEMATYDSFEVKMNPGDRLFLYSDGVTECESPEGELFGAERFMSFLKKHRDMDNAELITKLKSELTGWSCKQSFDDDLSLLSIRKS